jgi:cardiolipin synthase
MTSLLATVTRYTRGVARLRRGNALDVLVGGGPTFRAMLAAIAGAHHSICLETYIWDDDATGTRFADAIMNRARAGVAVRVIYDAIGGFGMSGRFVDRLRAAGVQVLEYHPIAPWRARFNVSKRDHRKILVVDDEIGFAGGINLNDDYAPKEDGGLGWHEVHCQVQGPAVADLAHLFRAVWIAEGGPTYPPPPRAEDVTARPGDIAVRVIDNSKLRRRGAIRRAYVTAIRGARRTILLENAYFLPDRRLRRALYSAVRRGVEVTVIVPGRSDVKAVEYAGHYVFRKVAAKGVRILCWQGSMMHAKTAVVDGIWTTIGSYNLDNRSLRHNLEVIVEILDLDTGAAMERQFRYDESLTTPFDPSEWHRRRWWQKALAWLAFRCRRWL